MGILDLLLKKLFWSDVFILLLGTDEKPVLMFFFLGELLMCAALQIHRNLYLLQNTVPC